ncbi:MAG TPA: response regulator transcription factor [Acidimicrobiales bacterium]|nr:response regulator transcription factor [Acidimicrobiales bacterium]
MKVMTRVLVVDDQTPFRRAARAVVTMTPGFDVVGEAETGEQAVELAHELAAELVLMDVKLPGISGIEATRRVVAAHPGTIVVLLSTYDLDELPGAATSGAVTYVAKDSFGPDLLADIWARREELLQALRTGGFAAA